MRACCLALLVAAALTGCSGFSIGVRQDEPDQAAFVEVLRRAEAGSRFPAQRLLAKRWTRLWVLPGGGTTQAVEDRIGIPFPQSGEELPAGSAYLVFDDGEAVVSAFSARVRPGCLAAGRAPLGPGTTLTVRRGGAPAAARLSAAAPAPGCR